MNKKLVFVFLIVVLQACAPNRYSLFSVSDFDNYVGATYYIERFIILPDSLLNSDSLIAFSYRSIRNGKYGLLEDTLKKYKNKQSAPYNFSSALFYYYNGDYDLALIYLKNIPDNMYLEISSLLAIDCEYEIYRLKENNEIYYLKKLQNLFKSTSSKSKYFNYMIEQREKNIKYGT